MYHHESGPGDAHGIHYWVYGNLAARDAHTPSEGPTDPITAADVDLHRICWVEIPGSFYVLVNFSPLTWAEVGGGGGGVVSVLPSMHLITLGEDTAGFFTLPAVPSDPRSVALTLVGGARQVNKGCVGGTGVTPDFEVLNTDECHFNGNGGAVGLSGLLTTGDVVFVDYLGD